MKFHPLTVVSVQPTATDAALITLAVPDELRDTFAAALADYRQHRWDKSSKGFRDCLTISPDDIASQVFLDRIDQFRADPPLPEWNGVWALHAK